MRIQLTLREGKLEKEFIVGGDRKEVLEAFAIWLSINNMIDNHGYETLIKAI